MIKVHILCQYGVGVSQRVRNAYSLLLSTVDTAYLSGVHVVGYAQRVPQHVVASQLWPTWRNNRTKQAALATQSKVVLYCHVASVDLTKHAQ